mmetsp:Transcript_20237/g.31264  ORF Transcript_20237/g.31264 Transcript_20237/m.31264 type:complete len:265 (+) Transcript_20237:79-873(+)
MTKTEPKRSRSASKSSLIEEENFKFPYLENASYATSQSKWWEINYQRSDAIHLYQFDINDEGAIKIGEFLCANNHFKKLSLINCGISSKGAIAIAEALEKNTSIRHVSLANNNIGPDGANAFWKMLKRANHRPMKTISLIGNNIGDEGLQGLLNGPDEVYENIPENLFLSNNNLTDMGAIISLVEKHHQIRHLFLDGNDMLSSKADDVLRFHLELNQSGRRAFLKDLMVPVGLWAHALAKVNPIQMYYLLQARPELCKPDHRVE